MLAAFHYMFSAKDPYLAESFLLAVIHGANLHSTHPAFLLRQRLVENATAKAKLDNANIGALTIKAWNATR